MKTILRSLLTLVVLSLGVTLASAQCIPNPNYTAPGIYPDTATGLMIGQVGVPYNDVITMVVPPDTSISGLLVTIDSINTESMDIVLNGSNVVTLNSAGLSYTCSPASCGFPGGTSGCISLQGTPNTPLGQNAQLRMVIKFYGFHSLLGPLTQLDTVYFNFSVQGSPGTFDVITGVVYDDINGNCQQDIGENGIPGRVISASPGNNFSYTDASGFYVLGISNTGVHTISASAPQYWTTTCPAPSGTHSVNILNQNQNIPNKDFGIQLVDSVNDIQVTLTNLNFARPGFAHSYKVDVRNVGTTTLSGNVELQHDALLHYNNSTPAHTAYSSNVISWDYGTLTPGASAEFRAYFTVDTQAVLGDYTYTTATVYPINGDTVPANNVDPHEQIIQGSYDPNDKAVIPADGISPEEVAAHLPLTYTIRFQNTGTDTAFTVVVRDTLSPNVNVETFEVLSTSHACVTEMDGPGNLAFTFNNILLPDSNVNEPASHGYIKYRIQPKSSLVLGDEIHNTAAIYFDFNAPVITNTTITEVKIPDGIHEPGVNLPVNIYPNPTSDVLNIVLLDETKTGNIELSMTNISGQVIRQMPLNQARLSISVSDLPAGFYFISLTENDEVRDTRKVIISKR